MRKKFLFCLVAATLIAFAVGPQIAIGGIMLLAILGLIIAGWLYSSVGQAMEETE